MKLTKKKLEQLIMEEISYFRPVKDEGKPKKFPHYADKLSTLAGSGAESYIQAQELSSNLHQGEDYDPIDVPMELEDMKTMPFVSDNDRIREFRRWMVSKGYGSGIRRIMKGLTDRKWGDAERIFKEYIDETKNYRVHNAVLGAYRVEHIPFLDEETGEPLPLGSPRPFRATNTYHYPRP